MLTFKQFVLLEGGNLMYTDEHGNIQGSSPTTIDQRSEMLDHANAIRSTLSKHLGESPVTPVGSAEHFHDTSIPDSEFHKVGKKKFGDLDYVVKNDHDTLGRLHELKKHAGKLSTQHHVLVHVKGSDDANDPGGVFTLWRHKKTGQITQIDLSPMEHDKSGKPDEGALWYKKTPKEDMFPKGNRPSIPGLGSKIALRAAASSFRKPVMIQGKKGLKRGESGVTLSIGGKVAPGARAKTRDTGRVDPETKLPIHEELPSKNAERELHPHKIGGMIFGRGFNPKQTDTSSIHGTIEAVKKHGTPEQQHEFVHRFAHLLYGEGAQVSARHDIPGGRETDHSKKDPIIHLLRQHFPDHPTLSDENMSAMKKKYNERAASRTRK